MAAAAAAAAATGTDPAADVAAAATADGNEETAANAQTISFKSLQRCRTTMEDFALTYFPLHRLELPGALFKFLDVLLYVEAAIYQMDEENEALSGRGALLPGHRFAAAAPLEGVLRGEGLWDGRIEAELTAGYRYWELERRICTAMESHDLATAWRGAAQSAGSEPPAAAAAAAPELTEQAAASNSLPPARLSPGFTESEALLAHESKSFDYRLLHLLLHHLAGRGAPGGGEGPHHQHRRAVVAYDEPLLSFLAADERLVDIGDDLTDYEDDVVANSFNIYRAYLHLYGPEAPLLLARRIGELEAERARLLARLPQWQRGLVEARQQAAADGQGADKWIFPQPILRERVFRERERGGGG